MLAFPVGNFLQDREHFLTISFPVSLFLQDREHFQCRRKACRLGAGSVRWQTGAFDGEHFFCETVKDSGCRYGAEKDLPVATIYNFASIALQAV